MVGADIEIDSFIRKFRQLWGAGMDAHLDLETHAGSAWIGLKLNLGELTPKLENEFQLKRASPSRLRRRERRAASFKQQDTKKNMNRDDTEEVVVAEQATSQVATEDIVLEDDVVSQDSHVTDVNTEQVCIENSLTEAIDEVDTISKVDNTDTVDDSVGRNLAEDSIGNDVACIDVIENINSAAAETIADVKPSAVTIHATAVIENSPFQCFCQDELDSIVRFVTNKDHLRKNVANIKYCNASTRVQNGALMHFVQIEILVNVESLWESPRSYLWKHVGQDSWERGNGSTIKLT